MLATIATADPTPGRVVEVPSNLTMPTVTEGCVDSSGRFFDVPFQMAINPMLDPMNVLASGLYLRQGLLLDANRLGVLCGIPTIQSAHEIHEWTTSTHNRRDHAWPTQGSPEQLRPRLVVNLACDGQFVCLLKGLNGLLRLVPELAINRCLQGRLNQLHSVGLL